MKTEGSDKEVRRPGLARLLNPRSVAIAGISATPGSLAATVLDNLERFGFSGKIHLIHPSRTELRGIRCVSQQRSCPMASIVSCWRFRPPPF
jgi:acetate---CoA ligase (ADP-forming)